MGYTRKENTIEKYGCIKIELSQLTRYVYK